MRSGIRFGIFTLLLMAWIPVIGCGGSDNSGQSASSTYTIGGAISGYTGTGLVLQNNGGNTLTVNASASSFTFSAAVAKGGVYSVTVLTQPDGENCTVSNGSGTASANVTNVSISCSTLLSIGGSVAGLAGPGLVLQNNGGDNLAVSAGASSFTFATLLSSGSAYNITVLTQPYGQSCVVTNGSGTASANVTSASVTCSQFYAVGGTVNGLQGSGLVLQNNGGDNLTVAANASSFVFATAVASGGAYNITVLSQPANESCTVANASGTVSADVINANVICVGEWTWMGGSNAVDLNSGQPGVYGTQGSPAPANTPGAREQSATWRDAAGNLWLFGGYGDDATDAGGMLNDLWKFDPTLGTHGEWTWISGSSVAPLSISASIPNGMPGVYGTLGTPSPTSNPGAREQAVSWMDAAGNLWLFGGLGIDAAGRYAYLNDLWVFNPSLGTGGEWAWMGGSSAISSGANPGGDSGVYGTQGTADAANVPGGRYGAIGWTDASGNFWLLGGSGYDSAGTIGYLNDLWKYTPGPNGTAGSWTWVSGASVMPPSPSPWTQAALSGVYGTLGVPDPANFPGGRSSGVAWADASGNFWIFGGLGADSVGNSGYLNDLWRYTPGTGGAAGEWTWMGGNDTIGYYGGQPGIYGVQGMPASTAAPGARFSPASWTDASGNLWMFAGQGYDWTGMSGFLNDLWKYTPDTNGGLGAWTWMGGSNTIPPNPAYGFQSGAPGVYGTLGSPAAANNPGSRIGAAPWVDADGSLWFFGGQGYDSTGAQGYLNDMWKYHP